MEFKLSREEEMIFREVQALAGDFDQLAENLFRHHQERLDEAKARMKDKDVAMPMIGLNRGSLLGDLKFLEDRLSKLIIYVEGGYYPRSGEGREVRGV